MVSPITSASSEVAGAASSASALSSLTGTDQPLGQDAFLKLLIAQIQHQDPLKPMDNTAFVAQLAQFSSLEQQVSTNQLLGQVAAQQVGLANSANMNLVGRSVTVSASSVSIDGSGIGAPLSFTLGAAADWVTVAIRNQSGQTVRTLNVGAQRAGLATLQWDGKDDLGTPQPAGAYTVSVQAKGPNGGPVQVSQETSGIVDSVSYGDGYANLNLSNGVSAPASELTRVNK